jgi:FAD/FMN-containing dehydrogenase
MSFDSLKRALPDKVFTPGTEQYNASLQSYYTAFERSLSPGTIVRPETAEEVSTIVKLARDETLQLAIKGGGAMPWAGAANINGGVTVDLENISGVTLSADNKTVQIGAGERWGNVFRILHEKGLATVGGRIPIVGVVGLILGGASITMRLLPKVIFSHLTR